MKISKSFSTVMFLLAFLTTACGEAVNIRDKQIYYWRNSPNSLNADLQIDLILKEYPSDLKTIYVENIIFTSQPGWLAPENYLNNPFAFQAGNPKRFAFHLNGYTTQFVSQGIPTTAVFGYLGADLLLNVDEWIQRDACPFKKIQLQGLSADVEVALPATLDIQFPCDLDRIKHCLRHDDFFGDCTEWAP